MTSTIERRIQALEEKRSGGQRHFVVVKQNEDGSWPPDPPGATAATLVIRLRRTFVDLPAAEVL